MLGDISQEEAITQKILGKHVDPNVPNVVANAIATSDLGIKRRKPKDMSRAEWKELQGKKPFGETGFGKFLKDFAPSLGESLARKIPWVGDDLADAIDSATLTQEEKEAAQSAALEYQAKLLEIQQKEYASARDMATEMAKQSDRWTKRFPSYLTIGLYVFAGCLLITSVLAIPEEDSMRDRFISIAESVLYTVMGFWLGRKMDSQS